MVVHDENRDLKSLSRIGQINYVDNTIILNKNSIIGIKMWGKLDFLRKHRGWIVMWDNKVVLDNKSYDGDRTITKEKIRKHHKII